MVHVHAVTVMSMEIGTKMSDQLYNETLIKECIIPLDELKEKLALVPLAVVREVLGAQGLVIATNREWQMLNASHTNLANRLADVANMADEWIASTDTKAKMAGNAIRDLLDGNL